MSFLVPKTETGVSTGDNTPGRSAEQSPRQILPLVLGAGRVAVQWVTPVLRWKYRTTSTSQFAFFSCFGWLAVGPIDEFVGLIVNDKPYDGIFMRRENVGGEYVDHVISKETPEKYRLWWGLENAANYGAYLNSLIVDAAHPLKNKPHPNYAGIAAIAVQDMEAGQVSSGQTPPIPKVEVQLYKRSVTCYSFGHVAHGVHPIGLIKDVLTLKRGGRGMPASMFDDAYWTAKAQQLYDDGVAGIKGNDLFVSAVLAEPREADEIVSDALSYFGGFLVEKGGKLYVDWQPNNGPVDETGLRVISEHELAGDVDEDPGDLDGIPSQVIVSGLDLYGEIALTESNESAPVPFVTKLVGSKREPETQNRPWLVTRPQQKSYAQVAAAMRATPTQEFTVPLLRQYACQPDGTTPLRPGDMFVLNLTRNGGKRVVVRIVERSSEDLGKVIFKVERERGTFPRPALPVLDPRVDLSIPPPADVSRYCVAQLPPDLSDPADTHVAALVERPSSTAQAFQLDFNATNSWPGMVLSKGNTRFAVCAVLRTVMANSYADITVTVDTVGDEWSTLRSQSVLEQNDDSLLCVAGTEWASVGTITPLGGGSYSISMKRARLSSLPAAHAIGMVLFFIPRADLIYLTHAEFSNIETAGVYDAGVATKWFKVKPIGAGGVEGNYSPAFSTTLRDPTPDQPGGLAATVGTGKLVDLTWNPVSAALVNEYSIWRATGPFFADEAQIGTTPATDKPRFIDTRNIVLGTQYRYRVKAHTTDENASPFSGTVFAIPGVVDPASLDHTLPANPTAPIKTGQGTYLADDGTVLSYLLIQVEALPARAPGAYLKVRRSGVAASAPWDQTIALFNTAQTTLRVNDLTPGQAYEVCEQAYNYAGDPGAAIAATGSPFTAPGKTSLPAAPTSITLTSPSSTVAVPPFYDDSHYQWYGCLATWPESTDKSVVEYEWVVSDGTDANADAFAATGAKTTATPTAFVYIQALMSSKLSVRAKDSSGNRGPWVHSAQNLLSVVKLAAGNMSQQSADNVAVTGLKTGSGSVNKVLVRAPYIAGISLAGGAPSETYNLNISGWGFSTAPDVGHFQAANLSSCEVRYDWDDSTSGTAVLRIRTLDGANLPTMLIIDGELIEYF